MGQKLGVCFACCGILFGNLALAECPAGQEPFTSCKIEGQGTEVHVCFDDQMATYRYGPIGGAPDLVLSEAVAKVDYEPWSGVGKAISETVTFYSGGFSYEVGVGFERPFSEDEMALGPQRFGWIDVAQNGQSLGRLQCIPDTVSFGFGGGIHEIKVAAGQEWDDSSKTWVGDVATQAPVLFPDDAGGCLVAPEFMLGGVAMGDRVETLLRLGSPEASGAFLPDGQEIDRITATGLDIDLLNDLVIGMIATDQMWDMPSGLRVGLTRGEVIAILGRVPGGAVPDADVFNAPVCAEAPQDVPTGMQLSFLGPTSVLKASTLSVGHDDFVRPCFRFCAILPCETAYHRLHLLIADGFLC